MPTLEALLGDRTTSPLALMRGLTARFGLDWLTWEPDALQMTLERELGVQVLPAVMSLALAGAAVAQHDMFWQNWEHFHFLTQALNGQVPDFKNHQELSVGQMMRAVRVAEQIREDLGGLSSQVPFSEEVARYVATQALQAGVWYLPPPLDFATRHASGLRYRCKDCGTVSEVLVDDGMCDVCVDRFNTSRLGAWRPDPERLAKGWGSNIEYFEANPTAPVAKRLKELTEHPGRTLQETQTDICVSRLLAAIEYANQPGAGFT